jgi:hypothetical protein
LIKDWQQRATNHRRQIEEWWTKWPNANVGLLLTPESRLVAIDVDNHSGASTGNESLARLVATYGPLPTTLKQSLAAEDTCPLPDGLNLKIANGRIADGIEYFTRRFMVLPPSLHKSALQYQWVKEDQQIAQVPDWIIERITTETTHQSEDREREMSERQLKHGERNTGLFDMGRVLRNDGLDQMEVRARLGELNHTVCEVPLPEVEIDGIVKSLFAPSSVSWANPVFFYE